MIRPTHELDINTFFAAIALEAETSPDPATVAALTRYYRLAGLLGPVWRRRFFQHHYARPLALAVPWLLDVGAAPVILDLGCGLGTQSILLASMGARVIGLDADPDALSVARNRAVAAGNRLARSLNIEFIHADALSFDYAAIGPLDGVYSLFAFNMMQPTTSLVQRISPAIRTGGRLAIQDGNPAMWYNRVFRRRPTLSPLDLARTFDVNAVSLVARHGCYSLPPAMWLVPGVNRVDSALASLSFFAGSNLYLWEKRESTLPASHRL